MHVSHFLYADDVVFVTEWSSDAIPNISAVLDKFYALSGLKLNVHKSIVYGVGVEVEVVNNIAVQAGCRPGILPFSYLGLPIGANMSRIRNWDPVIQKFYSRLSNWKAKCLSIGGRLTLIKAVLGSLPAYYMSMFSAPKSVIKKLESVRSNFFWGGNVGDTVLSWVKWNDILASYEKGGLNVGSLYAFNLALLQKWRWRFFTGGDCAWVRVICSIHG